MLNVYPGEVSDCEMLTVYPEVGVYVSVDAITGQCHMTCGDLLPTDNVSILPFSISL